MKIIFWKNARQIIFIRKFYGNFAAFDSLMVERWSFCAHKVLKIIQLEHRIICRGCVERENGSNKSVGMRARSTYLCRAPSLSLSLVLTPIHAYNGTVFFECGRAVHICSYDCLIHVKIDCLLLQNFYSTDRPIDDHFVCD